jgi:hypothetical protein
MLLSCLASSAFAQCSPSNITACPTNPLLNGLISGGPIQLYDTVPLVLSTDLTAQLAYDPSSSTMHFSNKPLRVDLGLMVPDGQAVILDATEQRARLTYDQTLGSVRLQNIPLQVDAGLKVPGGDVGIGGQVTVGNGLRVVGNYSGGLANAPLNFSGATIASGTPAIVVPDNTPVSFGTTNGFQIGSNTGGTAPAFQLSYNGAVKFAVDQAGNMTCAGTGCSPTSSQTIFSSGITTPSITTASAQLALSVGGVTYNIPAALHSILASGAKCDGVTDDTIAINNYFATLTTGSRVEVPSPCLINSGNLVIPVNVIVAGTGGAQGFNFPAGTQFSNSPGFIVNPTYSIVTNYGSQLLNLMIQTPGLLGTPTSAQAISAVNAWGAASSIGITVPSGGSRGVVLRDLFVIGFNTAVQARGGSFNVQNLQYDCYNGLDIAGAGDNTYIDNMRGEPYYSLGTSSGSGAWARPGTAFNIHDGNTGVFLSRAFAYMFANGLVLANTGGTTVSNSGFEWNDPLGNGQTNTTGIRWLFHNGNTSVHLSYANGFRTGFSVEATGEVIITSPTANNNSDGGTGIYLAGTTAIPATVTIAGTPSAGDTLGLTITSTAVAGSPLALPIYTVKAGDTPTIIGAAQAKLVNNNAALAAAHFYANNVNGVVTVYWPGAATATVSRTVTGGTTATIGSGAQNGGSYGVITAPDMATGAVPFISAGDTAAPTGRWTLASPFFTNATTLPTGWLSAPNGSESANLVLSGIPWSQNPTISACGATAGGFSNGTDLQGTVAVGNTTGNSILTCTATYKTPYPWIPKGVQLTADVPGAVLSVTSGTLTAIGFGVTSNVDLTNRHIMYTVIP